MHTDENKEKADVGKVEGIEWRQQAAQHQSEPKLTFRDTVTVQQTGVRVNVILWAQKKKKSRVKAAQEKQFVSVQSAKRQTGSSVHPDISQLMDPAQELKEMVETKELPVRWDILVHYL